jgi:hypothetical protein
MYHELAGKSILSLITLLCNLLPVYYLVGNVFFNVLDALWCEEKANDIRVASIWDDEPCCD